MPDNQTVRYMCLPAVLGLSAVTLLALPSAANAQDTEQTQDRTAQQADDREDVRRGNRQRPGQDQGNWQRQQRGPGITGPGRQDRGRPGAAGGGPWGQAPQFQRPGTFANVLQPDFQIRDMTIFAQQFELDQSQRPIIEALLIDYRQAFAEAARDVQEAARQAPSIGMGRGPMAMNFGQGDQPIRFSIPDGNQRMGLDIEGDVDIVIESISVSQTREQGSEDGEERSRNVSVIIMNQDGEINHDELPDEVRERLEQIQQRIERRTERMEERRREWREREEAREAAGEIMDPSEIAAIVRGFLTTKQQLHDNFVTDVNLMLAPWQQERWDSVQQSIRRLNKLPQNVLSGEQLDLHIVLRDLHLMQGNQRRLEPILEDYARDLDAALVERQRFLDEADIDRFEAMHADDWDQLLALADRESERRVAIRTVNDIFTQRVADALPEHDRDEFKLAVYNRSFPFLAMPSQVDRMLQRVDQLEDLDEEQLEQIAELRADHARALAALNAKHRQSIRESEPHGPRRMLEWMQQMREGNFDRSEAPMMQFMADIRERTEFGRSYIEQLRTIIPEAQMPELHQRDQRREWNRMGAMYIPLREDNNR
jgi:hypothetical protein